MYRIMYKSNKDDKWECLGSYDDRLRAYAEADRLRASILGKDTTIKVIVEGEEKNLD